MLANQASNYLIGGVAPQRAWAMRIRTSCPTRTFRRADGADRLAVGNDGQFATLLRSGRPPEWAADPRFRTNQARVAHRDELCGQIAAWLGERETQQWIDALDERGVPAAPVLDVGQVMDHPHVAARGMRLAPQGSEPPMIANPMLFDGMRVRSPVPPPALGRDDPAWSPRRRS